LGDREGDLDNQGCGILCGGDNAGANKKSRRDEGGDGGCDLGSEITGYDEFSF
jgi:hypothetical protein